MKKRYALAICLAAALRLQAQILPDNSGFGPQQVIIQDMLNNPTDVFTADLDGDGDQDMLANSSDKIVWYENDGAGNFGEQQVIIIEINGTQSVYAADLDGDGDQDVLSASLDGVAWYENDGSGSFGEQQVIATRGIGSVYATDLDGDGDQDVLSASSDDNKIAWYENDGAGNFGEQQVITTQALVAWSVYAADLDGDGDQDVMSASLGDDKVAWYENILPQSSSVPSIFALTLFNARNDTEVQALSDGLVLDLLSPEPNLYDYNVEAEVAAAG